LKRASSANSMDCSAAMALWVPLLLGACARSQPHVSPRTTDARGYSGAVPCFPIESLSDPDRRLADRVLLEFSEREGLYTLAGGLKPISSDVRDMSVRIAPSLDTSALGRLEQLRRISGALTCGELGVFVQVFTATSTARDSSMQRNTTLVLYHRTAVRRLVEKQSDFFATLGITPSADVRDIVAAVENAPRADRWRGYGYLFGYPDDAVDFFVRAGIQADSTRTFVLRDFRRVETFHKVAETQGGPAVTSSFVYAVPKGAAVSEGDVALRNRAAPIYARFVAERAKFIASDSSGAVRLWRRWIESAQR